MKVDKETYKAICFDDYLPDGWSITEEGDWISGGKYEYQTTIFTDGDKFYSAAFSRTGSHYTDWSYGHEWEDGPFECPEVVKTEKTITTWE